MIYVKKLMAVCAALAITASSVLPIAASAEPEPQHDPDGSVSLALSIEDPQEEYKVGDEITVKLSVTDVGAGTEGRGVNSWSVLVNYDKGFELLEAEGGIYGSMEYAQKYGAVKNGFFQPYAGAYSVVQTGNDEARVDGEGNPLPFKIYWTYGDATYKKVMKDEAPTALQNTAYNFTDTGDVATVKFKVTDAITKGNHDFTLAASSNAFRTYGTKTEPGDDNIPLNYNFSKTTVKINKPDPAVRVTSVTLPETASVKVGKNITLTPEILPANASIQTVTYTSSVPGVASVDANGKVTGLAAGTTVITATSDDDATKQATCTVTVSNIDADSISLDQSTMTLTKGQTGTLTPTILPEDTTIRDVTWTSNKPNIASVSNTGVVTAHEVGEATITASTVNGKTATCVVTVNPVYAETLSLNVSTLTLPKLGDTFKLEPTVLPANADNKDVTYTVAPEGVVSVAEDGTVTALTAGTATVTASVAGANGPVTATCVVNVPKATPEKTAETAVQNQTKNVKFFVNTDEALTYTFGDNAIPEADISKNGNEVTVTIRPTTTESSEIVVKDSTGAPVATVPVTVEPPVKYGAVIPGGTIVVKKNRTTAVPEKKIENLTFSIQNKNPDDPTVATVDTDGKITGVNVGEAVLTVADNVGNTYIFNVVVPDSTFTAEFDPSAYNIKVGDTTAKLHLKITADDPDEQAYFEGEFGDITTWDVTIEGDGANFISYDPATGTVLGKKTGKATIKATNPDYANNAPIYCTINVAAAYVPESPYNPNYGAHTDYIGPRSIVGNQVEVRVTDSSSAAASNSGSPIAATGGEFDHTSENAAAIAAGVLGVIALGFVVVARKKRRS